jgi:CBS domain-containing protein
LDLIAGQQQTGETSMTLVSEVMTPKVKIAAPDQTIQQAAGMMADLDAGIIPVADKDRLVGMITDRDIAVRAVAQGLPPDTQVSQVMSKDVKYCFDDDSIDDVARNMGDIKVRRLPVVNRDKRLVGILSLGDMAVEDGPDNAGVALSGISEPGGEHSQAEDGKH